MRAIATLIDTAMPRVRLALPVAEWIAVARERAALARLSPAQRADMGIDAEAARAEAARPFWDLPRR